MKVFDLDHDPDLTLQAAFRRDEPQPVDDRPEQRLVLMASEPLGVAVGAVSGRSSTSAVARTDVPALGGFGTLSLNGTSIAPIVAANSVEVLDHDLPSDDLFGEQYYLRNTVAGERDLGLFRGETSVWDDYTGAGVHVGIIDDGIDYRHSDLDGNYDASRHAIVGGQPVDGAHPTNGDAHGTAVAGIIAAERNGVGVVGIAYDASITSMAAISNAPNITLENAFANYAQFDVINNSWGYTSPWYDSQFNGVQAEASALLQEMVEQGRDGLGTIFVKSAGNGRGQDDNANFSFTNSHFGSVTVAAVLRDGTVSGYSTEGAALLVSAFGGPVPGDVVTTDRRGGKGYDDTDYTSGFNGTSAAGPMVAGIVALMLQANPDLGYRDVMQILAATARHTGTAIGQAPTGDERYSWDFNGAANWNGGGMHFSEDYGFGLVDALAAVRLAESWSQQNTAANLVERRATANDFTDPADILDNGSVSVNFTVAAGVTVEQVAINLGISHTHTGDLRMTLTSPDGTVSELLRNNGGNADIPNNGRFDVSLTSNMFRGEDSGGVWTLTISDTASGDQGSLQRVDFSILGQEGNADVFVFTEEYSSLASGARLLISDSDGGIDEINASAVFSALVIDLNAGQNSLIDGIVCQIDGSIENAIGGDGHDTLIGNNAANVLFGMRGGDSLTGGRGADRLIGGASADILRGGKGDDIFVFLDVSDSLTTGRDRIMDFKGGDIIDLSQIDADIGAVGRQAFTQVATLTGAAGQLVLSYNGGSNTTTLAGDVNGDGVADFEVRLKGEHLDSSTWML
jgi:subtilisin-like proprotein convertase family protein